MNYREDMDLNYRDYPCESKSIDYLDVRLAIERDTEMIIREAEISHKDNFDEFYDRDLLKPDKVRLFFDGNKSPIFGMVIYKIHQKKDDYWRSACGGYYPIYKNKLFPHPYQESICW